MGKIVFIFPGQGSQYVGMGKDLYLSYPEVQELFAACDERLGANLTRLCFEGPVELLAQTENTQPAVLLVSLAALMALRAAGVKPQFVAGHSLGEYSALVAAGVLDPLDACWLVRQRGRYMEGAVPGGRGAMAAVLGLEYRAIAEACRQAEEIGPVVIANLNAPGQVVISGVRPAVEEVAYRCRQAGAKKVVFLEVSGPFHSPLMQPAVEQLEKDFARVRWKSPAVPVIANCLAQPVTEVEAVRKALLRQLTSPVRWQESLEYLAAQGVTTFIELGPGRVLSGLVKRTVPGARVCNVEDRASLEKTLASLQEAD
ncbi:MAG: ACP S-malonyltransferase [Moorellales bacterium]